jgi:hypothetical protein
MSLDPSLVRVWRDAWWRLDAGSWAQVETAPSSAQWSAPAPEIAAQLRDPSAEALKLSGEQPIAFVMADRGIGPAKVYLATHEWGAPYARVLVGDAGAESLLRLPRPPLGVVLRPHPHGPRGIKESTERVRDAIERGRNNRYIVTWTRQQLHAAGLEGARGNPSPDQIVRVVFASQKREVSFLKDPVNGELMLAPEQLLCLDPHGACTPAGDCDDQLIVAGSAIASAGVPVRLVIRTYPGQKFGHVTLEYDSAPRLGGPWKCLDPSTDSGVCSSVPYLEQTIVEIVDPSDQTFMGLGDPAGAGAPGTLGQPPPGSVELPPDQAAGWIAQLARTQTSLASSTARLRSNSQALAAVRADLGLPAVDPSTGEAVAGGSPLAAYMQSGAWTAEAQAAESKLLQTADFISGCIADGLSGARALYFSNGDILIEAKPGDPYAIRMAPGPNGGMVPTYFDAAGAPAGTLGIFPIIVWAAIVAVTLAVAYVVGKVCDQLATTHHDDALNKIADQQTALVASGKQTPAQAAGMVAALTDLDKANPTPPSTLQKFLDTFPVIGVLGAAAAGVAAGFGLSRLVGSIGSFGFGARRAAASPSYRRRKEIEDAEIVQYADNGETVAYVTWSDGSTTTGDPDGVHMTQLLGRAEREGLRVREVSMGRAS